ncbi:MAG TPA: 7-cyano-7-deazaguanine synthase [Candidatus Nanoarchaeia archaeon]|nr:7-cyano-7-deazaguanine synthase [Candidatus Nanoarchaeia archaeon]
MSRALLLLSGGFDSAVAGFIMQQKGLEVIALHLSNEPFTDNGPEIKARALAEHLNLKKFIVVNVSNIFGEIAKKCTHEYYFVLIKRVMLRIANNVAKEENCNFIITGENLAQVSSQTLKNLKVITEASDIEVLRPLLTFDKNEIIKIAREIGTYDISCGPEVCDVLGPKHPVTKTNLEEIEKEEKKLIA